MGREEAGDRRVWDARSGTEVRCTGEAKRKGENREAWWERRVRNERAGKTTGEHGGHGLAGSGNSAARIAEDAEVDREEEGRVPPCGDGSGGEAARKVRRAWAWRSAVEGSGGGED